jgi:FtsX-like permease family/MacB-like periplasmic core domain
MSAVIALARADLRSRWRGWLSVTLLLAVAGGVVLATLGAARRTDTAYARYLQATRGADVEVAVSGPGGQQNAGGVSSFYAALARAPQVAVVAPTIGISAVVPSHGNAPVLLDAGTDTRFRNAVEDPKITAGRKADPAQAGEVMADRAVAASLHLHVGSVLHLRVVALDGSSSVPTTVRVVGLVVTRDNVVPVTATAAEGALLVTPALLHRLTPRFYTFDAAYVRLRPGASIAGFRRSAQRLVSQHPETGGNLFVVDLLEQAAKVERAIRPQAVALSVFALLVALTSVLIISQLLAREVVLASNDNRTLRALGMNRRQLTAVGLTEAVPTIVVGAVLAVVVAVLLSPLTPIGPARVAEPHPGIAVHGAILGIGAVAIVAVFVLLLIPGAWRVAKESSASEQAPARGIRRHPRVLEGVTRSGAPVSAVMGARFALQSGRGRAAIPVRSTLIGITVAVAAVAAAFTFGTNLVRLVNTPQLYGQTWQLTDDVEFGHIAQRDVGRFLNEHANVTTWSFGNHTEVSIGGRRVPGIALTRGKGRVLFPELLEGRPPRQANEIALGTKTLASVHRRVGQTVTVEEEGEKAPRTMRVVGRAVFPYFGQGEVTPTGLGDGAATLDASPHPDGFNFFLVGMRHGATDREVAQLARDLKASDLCREECRVVTSQRPTDVSNYARITATPLVLAGVLALLATATLAHLLVTSIRRRRRDIAVLKTLGFTRRQVSAVVAWQASIVVAVALVIGLPIGIAAGRWAWLAFGDRLGVTAAPQVQVLPIALAILGAFLLANVIAAGPGWIAARLQPAAALGAE